MRDVDLGSWMGACTRLFGLGVSLWRWFGDRCGRGVCGGAGRVRGPGASGRCRVGRFPVAACRGWLRCGSGDATVVDYFVEVAVDEADGVVGNLA
jgi:hypothetical protein